MAYQTVLDYITAFWPQIIRQQVQDVQTRIGLPKPYIVPSNGEMFQEMYYWDSFFEALGVVGTEYEHLILDMTENMLYLFNRFGVIPNGSRYYFLSRSQPPSRTKCERKEPEEGGRPNHVPILGIVKGLARKLEGTVE